MRTASSPRTSLRCCCSGDSPSALPCATRRAQRCIGTRSRAHICSLSAQDDAEKTSFLKELAKGQPGRLEVQSTIVFAFQGAHVLRSCSLPTCLFLAATMLCVTCTLLACSHVFSCRLSLASCLPPFLSSFHTRSSSGQPLSAVAFVCSPSVWPSNHFAQAFDGADAVVHSAAVVQLRRQEACTRGAIVYTRSLSVCASSHAVPVQR